MELMIACDYSLLSSEPGAWLRTRSALRSREPEAGIAHWGEGGGGADTFPSP